MQVEVCYRVLLTTYSEVGRNPHHTVLFTICNCLLLSITHYLLGTRARPFLHARITVCYYSALPTTYSELGRDPSTLVAAEPAHVCYWQAVGGSQLQQACSKYQVASSK